MIYTDGTYLISNDCSGELHIFAQKIGLKREWYKANAVIPHYHIQGAVVKKAISNGAKKVSTTKLAEIYCKR